MQAGPHSLHHSSSPFMNVLERDTREGGLKKAAVKRDREKVERRRETALQKKKKTSAAQPSNTKLINSPPFSLG